MPTLTITVRGKIAQAAAGASIVCGNTGYQVVFDLDEEWAQYTVRTARFAYVRNGVRLYQDVLFSGNTADVPVMWDVQAVNIGLYAGNVLTSTGAVVPCTRSATDDEAEHPDPAPDVYDQLLEYLAGAEGKDRVFANDILINSPATTGEAAVAELVLPHFSCDTGYYFDTEVQARIGSATYQKTNDLPAVGVIIHIIGYTSPLFISPIEDGCYYGSNTEVIGSVQYDGLTWYYARVWNAQGGTLDDSLGNMLTYPTDVLYDSTNDRPDPQSVLDILAYVHAQKED